MNDSSLGVKVEPKTRSPNNVQHIFFNIQFIRIINDIVLWNLHINDETWMKMRL